MCSRPRSYRCQISCPCSRASSSGAKRPKNRSGSSRRAAASAARAGCRRHPRPAAGRSRRALRAEQDVEFGEVAVHDAGAQHPHHLGQQPAWSARASSAENDSSFSRGAASPSASTTSPPSARPRGNRRAPARARGPLPADRSCSPPRSPGRFVRLAPEARALVDGARLARVLHPAALGVVHRLPEAALVGFLVDLGAAGVLAAAHHVDGRLPCRS